jgi:hypothetical protein
MPLESQSLPLGVYFCGIFKTSSRQMLATFDVVAWPQPRVTHPHGNHAVFVPAIVLVMQMTLALDGSSSSLGTGM